MFRENIWSLLTYILGDAWFVPDSVPNGKSSRRSYAFLGLLGAHDLGPFPSPSEAQHAEPHWTGISDTFIHTCLLIFQVHSLDSPSHSLLLQATQHSQLPLTQYQIHASVNTSNTHHNPPYLTSRRRYLVLHFVTRKQHYPNAWLRYTFILQCMVPLSALNIVVCGLARFSVCCINVCVQRVYYMKRSLPRDYKTHSFSRILYINSIKDFYCTTNMWPIVCN